MKFRRICAMAVLLGTPISQGQIAGAGDRVSGKVLDAKTGSPLPHALVTLEPLQSRKASATTYSAQDGSYRFDDPVPPGKYRLQGRAAGHLAAAYLQHGPLSTAIVTGAGLPTDALVLSLMPVASISGRVLDEDGDPVPHATVSLFRLSPEAGTTAPGRYGMQNVDDSGEFDFGSVAPGRYFLAARGTPWYAVHPPVDQPGAREMYKAAVDPGLDVAYPTVFYPAAFTQDGASPIDITGGEQVTADMRLVPQHAVTLTLRRAAGAPNAPPAQLMEDVFGSEQPVMAMMNITDSAETVSGIPPGRYVLREFSGDRNRLPVNAGSVDLTNGSAVRNAAAPEKPNTVILKLKTAEAEGGALPLQVTLSPGRNGPAVSSKVDVNGEAQFTDVPAGDYRLLPMGRGRGNETVGSVTVNGHMTQGNRLRVADGDVSATVTLSGPPVTVEGFVQRGGNGVPACMVVLVPAESNTDAELFRRDQTDLDGSFTLPSVSAGKYLVVALEDAWQLPWTDLHALEPYLLQATPLVVTSNRSGSVRLSGALVPQRLH